MWCVAICHDIKGGGAARSALFQAHVEHNLARMGMFLLTGPTANADGSTGIGDDPRLTGSIYCLDAENLAAARGVMEGDPFMNGAWERVDYYAWRAPSGVWLDESKRPKGLSASYRCYVAASQARVHVDEALMSGSVEPLASTGAEPAALAYLALIRADAIEEARARAAGADWVAAIPIAIGRWVGISSPADLPAPAA
jgi:uncharacterized protein YciI